MTTKRDLKIYELWKVYGLTQTVIAKRFGLQQKSVSEICRRVASERFEVAR